MTGNLIGEEFDDYVFSQIKDRQLLTGMGYDVTNLSSNNLLSPREINILNNKNSFIKLASGVNFFDNIEQPTFDEAYQAGALGDSAIYEQGSRQRYRDTPEEIAGGYIILDEGRERFKLYKEQIAQNNINQKNQAKQKLRNMGFEEDQITSFSKTNKLAQNAVLYSGLSALDPKTKTLTARSGISEDLNLLWNQNSAYGLGGRQFGQQPMPGITSAAISCLNRGSIRSATVQIKAYNTFQFQLIELLYLKLGFTMMLEWGHTKYISNGSINPMGTTITEDSFFNTKDQTQLQVLKNIESYRERYAGNYDGFFGRVTNFSWDFSPNGTYDITLKLITLGDIIESLQINIPSPIRGFESGDNSSSSNVNSSTTIDTWLDSYAKATANVTGEFTPYKPNKNYLNLLNANYDSQSNDEQFRYTNPDGTITVGNQEFIESIIRLNNPGKVDGSETNAIYQAREKRIEAELKLFQSQINSTFNLNGGLTKMNSYYTTFGNLLKNIVDSVIPRVISGDEDSPILEIGTDEKINIVSAQPNQVSFDLSVCYVKPQINVGGVNTPQFFLKDSIKDFFVLEKEGNQDILYGQLMNVYLNFDFIKSCLRKNTSKDGTLSLFNFLTGICDGINSSLGNVNKIEPIINSEINELVFIDQNPIRGNSSILKKLLAKVPAPEEIVPLEVFGFNTTSGDSLSNFVKDFKFETKIPSNLASMISIGTTAGGSSSKVIDGTAFTSINAGLIDRFQKQILPPPNFPNPVEEAKQVANAQEEDIDTKFSIFWGVRIKDVLPTNKNRKLTTNLREEMNKDENRTLGVGNSIKWNIPRAVDGRAGDSVQREREYGNKVDVKSGVYNGYNFTKLSYSEALKGFKKFKEGVGKDVLSENDIDLSTSYQKWLIYAFSGIIIGKTDITGNDFTIPNNRAQYLNVENKDFFKKGKQAFREYIRLRDQKAYRITGSPSNQSGFLPIELSITLDGISGVKIYQKLNINQKFLPQEYKTNNLTGTLDFVITKVDHKLSNNKWETILSTLSIPQSKALNNKNLDTGVFNEEELNIALEKELITEVTSLGRISVSSLSPDSFIKEALKKSEGYYSGGNNKIFRSSNVAYAYPDPKPNSKIEKIKAKSNYVQGEENEPWTIGYGQTYYAQDQIYTRNGITKIGLGTRSRSPVKEGDSISKSSAEIGFEKILSSIAKQMVAKNRIKVPLTQNEYNALLSFSYNSGPGISNAKIPLYSLLNAKDYIGAGFKLETTLTNNGQLTNRRMEESSIFFTDNPGNPT